MSSKPHRTTFLVVSILLASGTQVDAQTMDEAAALERRAMALVASEKSQYARESGEADRKFAFTTPEGTYHELAFVLDDVPIYRKTSNLKEADMIRATDARRSLAVSGMGVEIGLWDNGPAFGHPEFYDRLTLPAQDGSSTPSSHATHVAGTLAATGLDHEATGMAPEARLASYDWRFDYVEMYAAAQEGLRVSNHSYSLAAGWEQMVRHGSFAWNYRTQGPQFGEYGVMSWFWDDVMAKNPYYLAVKAAGNEGGQGPAGNVGHYHDGFGETLHFDSHEVDCGSGFGCLGSLSTSKNALVVGALSDDGSSLAEYSSRGPALDGRIKPDVVSAGTGVYSTYGADGYRVSSGTSMAAPTVAGSIALMIDLERRLFGFADPLRSSTLKALLIHGSDDLGNPGPDYQYGWGRVNVETALDLMVESQSGNVVIVEPAVDQDFVIDAFADGGELKVTLSWIDPIGRNPNGVRDKSAPVLVEDLDITIAKDGNVYYPFVLDPNNPETAAVTGVNDVDNVEQIHLADVAPGPFRIRISRKNATTEPISASLVVSGINGGAGLPTSTEPNPALMEAVTVYPNPVRPGGTVTLEGSLPATQQIQVDLIDSTGRTVSTVSAGPTERLDTVWSVPAHLSGGMYFLRIVGETVDEAIPLVIVR